LGAAGLAAALDLPLVRPLPPPRASAGCAALRASAPAACRPQVWSTRSVEGVHRFLARAFRIFEAGVSDAEPSQEQMRLLHQTIKKVNWGLAGWPQRPARLGPALHAAGCCVGHSRTRSAWGEVPGGCRLLRTLHCALAARLAAVNGSSKVRRSGRVD
jgi:hypothetical protein